MYIWFFPPAFTLELKLCALLHNCCTFFFVVPDCHPCLRSLPQCVFICRFVGLLKITKLADPAVCPGFALARDFSGLLFLAAADSFPTLVFCNGEGNDGGLHFGCGHLCICACEHMSRAQTTAVVWRQKNKPTRTAGKRDFRMKRICEDEICWNLFAQATWGNAKNLHVACLARLNS